MTAAIQCQSALAVIRSFSSASITSSCVSVFAVSGGYQPIGSAV
jgi:hypothetical protein